MTYYGIYKITNLVNGKMYIGQHTTNDIDDGYMGSGKIIRRAIKKYGKSNFRKEWLMFCEDSEELDYMERVFVDQTWIDRADTYNLCLGGVTNRGYVQTDEQRLAISLRMKGCISPMKGKHHSETARRKMSSSKKGKPSSFKGKCQTEEARRKMSMKLKGRTSIMRGKHHTEETKRKISISQMKSMTDERKKRIAQTLCGRKNPIHADRMSHKKWYNNGIKSIMSETCPEGFVAGRITKKHNGGK